MNKQYAKTFTIEDTSYTPTFPDKNILSYLVDIMVEEAVVRELLLGLRIDKSPGPDQLHPRILKEVAEIIAKPLTYIYTS